MVTDSRTATELYAALQERYPRGSAELIGVGHQGYLDVLERLSKTGNTASVAIARKALTRERKRILEALR